MDMTPMPPAATATLYWNARIWTGDKRQPWADALLVRGDRIAGVGRRQDVAVLAAGAGRVDLGGRLVLPGFHDAHIHLLASGLKFRTECRLTANALSDQVIEDICECPMCRNGRLSDWIIGGEINPNVYEPGSFDRRFLDKTFPDRPVYLYDYTTHHALVNSKALELAGIDATTEDPFGGRYVRRGDGREPTGELVERGTWAVKRVIPDYEDDVYLDALKWAVGIANKFGITSVQEASASLPELKALNVLDRADELSLHVAAHVVWREEAYGGDTCERLEELIARRDDFSGPHVRTNFVKCWLDGAPLPPHFTQSDLKPDGEIDHGKIQIPFEDLVEMLTRLDREGTTLKIHCAGMGAVRHALNAIAEMRRVNGDGGPVHEIAHAGFIHPDDRGRLSRLRAIAEMSPAIWHYKGPEFAGLADGFKFRTMSDTGAVVTIGSDWIITADPNLFPALGGMLDRGAESVDLETALRMLTLSGASAVGLGERTGSIEVGKSADFIVLDRDLFRASIEEIGETTVLNTVFEGKVVYAAENAPVAAA